MIRSRIAVMASAVLLGIGVTAPAFADGSSGPTPVVSQSAGGVFTVDLPGVGSLTFTVDPTTGAVSGVVATAASGFSAGAPTVSAEGVQVSFTGGSGAVTLLQAEIDHEDGTVTVKPEAETEQPDAETADTAGPNGTTTSSTEAEHEDTRPSSPTNGPTTTTTEAEHEDGGTSADTSNGGSTASTSTTEQPDGGSSTSPDGVSSGTGSGD